MSFNSVFHWLYFCALAISTQHWTIFTTEVSAVRRLVLAHDRLAATFNATAAGAGAGSSADQGGLEVYLCKKNYKRMQSSLNQPYSYTPGHKCWCRSSNCRSCRCMHKLDPLPPAFRWESSPWRTRRGPCHWRGQTGWGGQMLGTGRTSWWMMVKCKLGIPF